jgi:hypothetical protein
LVNKSLSMMCTTRLGLFMLVACLIQVGELLLGIVLPTVATELLLPNITVVAGGECHHELVMRYITKKFEQQPASHGFAQLLSLQ